MSEWNNFGKRIRDHYGYILEPDTIVDNLVRYKNVIQDFDLKDLLKIYDIQAKSEIAAAITEMPEFLFHEIGQMRTMDEVDTVTGGLYDLAKSIESCGELINNAMSEISESVEDVSKSIDLSGIE